MLHLRLLLPQGQAVNTEQGSADVVNALPAGRLVTLGAYADSIQMRMVETFHEDRVAQLDAAVRKRDGGVCASISFLVPYVELR